MKIVFFANTDWFLYNFKRNLAVALRNSGHEVVMISPAGKYGEKLQSLGFRWIPAPMNRASLNPVRELAFLWWLIRTMKAENPALVHCFTVKCVVYGCIAAKLAGVSGRVAALEGMGFVFTSGACKAKVLRPVVTTLLKIALRGRNGRLVLLNPDDAELACSQRLAAPSSVRLIPGAGVDCSRFRPVNESAHRGKLKVLLPARLLWDKGIREYAQASRLLRSEGRDMEFLVAGSPDAGNPASISDAEISTWEHSGLIRRLGHVEDMPSLLQSVDIVVLPSYREGLPTGLIEGAACGKALVTTDAPGCRSVVDHGVNGLIVPTRDANELARAIAQLQDDPDLRSRLGLAARAKAVREFDVATVVERTLAVYAEFSTS